MPDGTALFGDLRAAELFGWFVAVGAFMTGLVMLLRKILPLLKKLSNFLDDVVGEPERPGVPARPGLMERVMRVEHELFPNSGKSLRDQTNRIEEKLDTDNVRIGVLSDQINTQTERINEHLEWSQSQAEIIESLKKEKDEPS